jgi:hypothetical protein
LNGNAEFETLGKKYGVDNTTDTSALEKKIITYVTLHYLTVHKWLGSLNDNWKAAKFYQVGFDAASYGHTVLGLGEEQSFEIPTFEIQKSKNRFFKKNIEALKNLRF